MKLLDGKRGLPAKIAHYGVCEERVGCNSIKCLKCKKFIAVPQMFCS